MSKPDWKDKGKKALEDAEELAGKVGKPDFMKKAKQEVEKMVDETAEKVKAGKPDFMKKAVDQAREKVEEVVDQVTGPEEYTVAAGDNLSAISKKFYGTPNNWKAIYEANKDVIKDPNVIRPGMVLKIPKQD